MKTIWISTLSVAALISFTQCSQITAEKLCADQSTRGKIISTLVNDEMYMAQVMDSMRTIHSDVIVSAFFVLAQNDTTAQLEMMDKMMDIAKSDTSMCRMLISKTMDMCDADQAKCGMMADIMANHEPEMKCMMHKMNEIGLMDKACMQKSMMNLIGDPH